MKTTGTCPSLTPNSSTWCCGAASIGASSRVEVGTFDSETLYEYIDGAADGYLDRGFQRCAAADSTIDVQGGAAVELTIEVQLEKLAAVRLEEKLAGGRLRGPRPCLSHSESRARGDALNWGQTHRCTDPFQVGAPHADALARKSDPSPDRNPPPLPVPGATRQASLK